MNGEELWNSIKNEIIGMEWLIKFSVTRPKKRNRSG